MKIELIKETEGLDGPVYLTKVDGKYVSGSVSRDEKEAKQFYDLIIANNGCLVKREVIESKEI